MIAGGEVGHDKILIVESDLQVAAWLTRALHELGFDVDNVYHDTESAFAAFHGLNFSLYHPFVILDGDLDRGGSEVIARFLANKGINFILHTDRDIASDEAFRNMMFSVLPKSRNKESLASVVEKT